MRRQPSLGRFQQRLAPPTRTGTCTGAVDLRSSAILTFRHKFNYILQRENEQEPHHLKVYCPQGGIDMWVVVTGLVVAKMAAAKKYTLGFLFWIDR